MATKASNKSNPSKEKTQLPEFVARPADLPKADLSEIALNVLRKRYLIKDESGKPVEQPEDMFWRVAFYIAREDARYGASKAQVLKLAREFYLMMTRGLWEPNSPTLMNAGRPLGQLSACFVLPVEDTLSNGKSGIYDTLRSMALVHQSGGGTGFSFSRLRPKNSIVRSTTGVASGPVSFMSLYDSSTEVVKQGGTRRGANMGILRVDHPDILDFIDCKQDITKITNFNISVAITDKFMQALAQGGDYELVHPKTKEVVGTLNAAEVFEKVVKNAWTTGEPGVFFIDEANRFNPVPHIGEYEATNPCGEQPLLAYDVCNLGSINLGAFFKPEVPADRPWTERFDWEAAKRVIHLSTHFLDNVIDANSYPLPEITDLAQRIRRIGNGVMGLADLLVRLGIAYDSPEGVEVSRALAQFFDEECKVSSEGLAQARGTFPEWEKSIWGPDATCARDAKGKRIRPMRRLRNCNVDTVAPTGTISIIAGCSSGIEPLFAVAFMRNQAGSLMADVNEDFVKIAKSQGWHSDELMTKIATEGHIHFPEVPVAVQQAFRTAHDITPEWHVRTQAAWQEYIDSAISKTTNFPHEATEEDVRKIYELAFELKCKGVTVYRDGSRMGQVLSTGATKSPEQLKAEEEAAKKLEAEVERLREENESLKAAAQQSARHRTMRGRPNVLRGTTRRVTSPLGDVYVTINEDPAGKPFEAFATLGKAGSVAMADCEAIGRLISLSLRSGVPVEDVIKQLRGISSDQAVGFGPHKVLSLPDAIAQALEQREKERAGIQQELIPSFDLDAAPSKAALPGVVEMGVVCDNCKGQMTPDSGCYLCHFCGHSKCG